MKPTVDLVKHPAFGPDVEVTCTVDVVDGAWGPEVRVTHDLRARATSTIPWSEIQCDAHPGRMLDRIKQDGLRHLLHSVLSPVTNWMKDLRGNMRDCLAMDPWCVHGELAKLYQSVNKKIGELT